MTATFTDDDVEKRVETATGKEIGTVAAIEGNTARVEPDPGVIDSIRATLGWRETGADPVTIRAADVEEITADAIRLAANAPPSADAGSTPAADPALADDVGPEATVDPESTLGGDAESAPESDVDRAGADVAATEASSPPDPDATPAEGATVPADADLEPDERSERAADPKPAPPDRDAGDPAASGDVDEPAPVEDTESDGAMESDEVRESDSETGQGAAVSSGETAAGSVESGPAESGSVEPGSDESGNIESEGVGARTGGVSGAPNAETAFEAEVASVADRRPETAIDAGSSAGEGSGDEREIPPAADPEARSRPDGQTADRPGTSTEGRADDDEQAGAQPTPSQDDEGTAGRFWAAPSEGIGDVPATPLGAAFAAQRATIEGSRQALDVGMAAQETLARTLFEGPLVAQRGALDAMEAATAGYERAATAAMWPGTGQRDRDRGSDGDTTEAGSTAGSTRNRAESENEEAFAAELADHLERVRQLREDVEDESDRDRDRIAALLERQADLLEQSRRHVERRNG